jgi:dTDP-4-amino-4,6-dideoxygalactose transaminase
VASCELPHRLAELRWRRGSGDRRGRDGLCSRWMTGIGGARWPVFEADEIEAAQRVLRSGRVNYWTGDEGRQFEREFSECVGVKHAVALANGTVALELALWALGIDGGEVVVPSRTFVATASAVLMRGAVPVFAEVDRDSGCVTTETIEACLSPRTRAVIVVHLGGWPCDMPAIVELCRRRGVALIEDCAQAHGATVSGRQVGSFGDAAAFSFCQDKIMTTAGEGGMLVTNDEALFKRAWSRKDHGKDWALVHTTEHPPGFRWLHAQLGTNWRLSEVQSAIGRVQLRKLEGWVAHRRELTDLYLERLGVSKALRTPVTPEHVRSACYKLHVYVRPETLGHGWSRDRILEAVTRRGFPVAAGSCGEIYLEEMFPFEMRPAERHPVARDLAETSLLFLVDPTVTREDVERTCDGVLEILSEANR